MKHPITYSIILILAFAFMGQAQEVHCNMYKLPFEQMVDESNRIAYAEVVSGNSFWNEKQTMIYTYYQLRVLQSLKGSLPQEVTLVVEGGRAHGMLMEYQDRIEFQPGARMVIMLSRIPRYWDCAKPTDDCFAAYASKQGVFMINEITGSSSDVFNRFETADALMNRITGMTGKPAVVPQQKFIPNQGGNTAVATVTSLTPTTLTAGTGSVLTIAGSGFGATRGTGFVEFTTVNGGFAQPLPRHYISWTDTQIQVFVPSLTTNAGVTDEPAATGVVRVTPQGGATVTSPSTITVRYALFNRLNASLDSTVTLRMVNDDAAGGYTFNYNDQFAALGAGAQASLERALSAWKCATRVNMKIASATTTIRATGADNFNVITDDIQAPLPPGILGRGLNLVALCGSGQLVKALTLEMDVIVDASPSSGTWNFSAANPSATQFDFETVFLHELGHLHQLSHTKVGGSEVMVPTVSLGATRRSLHQNDLDAANDAMARSIAAAGCSIGSHIQLVPSLSITSNVVFPVCNPVSVTFTATTTNMTSNTTLNWFRNGVQVAQGTTYTLNAPVNNDVVFCQFSACTTIRSNSITLTISNNTATITYAASYCKSVTTAQSVTRTGAAGGTYTASPAGLTINASTGAITPSTSTVGTYTITYTVAASGACAQFSTIATVSIGAAPTVSMVYGSSNYCRSQTGSVSPTTTASGPVTYSVAPAGLTLNTSTGAFTPSTSAAGSYTVTASVNGTGACAGTVVTAVRSIVLSSPLATPGVIAGITAGVCGSTKNYSISAVAGASSYTWTVPAGASITGPSTGTTISVVFTSSFTSGSITVRANALNGCNSGLRSLTVSGVPSQPGIISSTSPILGSTTVSIPPVSGATSFVWTVTGATIISGQGTTAISILGFIFSSATVCVRAVNACGQSAQRCANVNTLQGTNGQQGAMESDEAIETVKFVAPAVYPNPAEDILNVSFEESKVAGDVMVDIMDAGGLLIHRAHYNEIYGTRLQLSLQDLPVGMYMLRMQSLDGTVHTQRFIKQ